MTAFMVEPRGHNALATSVNILEGFTPAAYKGAPRGHVHLAFPVDGTRDAAGVCLTQEDEQVTIEMFDAADPDLVRDQAVRILSLDVDGSDIPNPVVTPDFSGSVAPARRS